jgi:hypothetical protein
MMIVYRIITTGDDLEQGAAYQQFGQWTFVDTHNDGELWEVEISEQQADALERLLDTDHVVAGYGVC